MSSAFQRRIIWVAAAILVATAAVRAAESLQIRPVVRDNQVLVSFELEDAYTDTVKEAIASGLKTKFTYDLELRVKVAGWFDRVVSTAEMTVSDQYDNLTRRHTLTRSVDGRFEEVTVTESESAVRSWLTTATRVPLCDTSRLDASRDYYVRVTTRAHPATGSLLGLARTITGQAKFTFIP